MQEVVTCHWFCESCNSKVGKNFPNLVNLHERMNNNEKAIAKVEVEVEKTNGHWTCNKVKVRCEQNLK